MSDLELEHRKICQKFGADYHPLDLNLELGMADNISSDIVPLNGLRHPEEKVRAGGICGLAKNCPRRLTSSSLCTYIIC